LETERLFYERKQTSKNYIGKTYSRTEENIKMNGVVACTLLDAGANRSCILRLYIGNTKNPDLQHDITYGRWDWIGGTYRTQNMIGNSGGWMFNRQTLRLGGVAFTPNQPSPFAFLSNVPKNFLDIGPYNTARGVCEFPNHIQVTWSIWFRAS
jgi:hypothetical protein